MIGQILELRRYLNRRHPIIYNKDIETDKWVFVQFTTKALVITITELEYKMCALSSHN